MDKDIDTFESLSASFEVQGFGVPRPIVEWYVLLVRRKYLKKFIFDFNLFENNVFVLGIKMANKLKNPSIS